CDNGAIFFLRVSVVDRDPQRQLGIRNCRATEPTCLKMNAWVEALELEHDVTFRSWRRICYATAGYDLLEGRIIRVLNRSRDCRSCIDRERVGRAYVAL